jgi:hypothetical protein
MQAQGADWVDAIRYFRGLRPTRRRRIETIVFAAGVAVLSALTVLATFNQFG